MPLPRRTQPLSCVDGAAMDAVSFKDALQGVEQRLDQLRAAVEARPFRSPDAPGLAPAPVPSKPAANREASPATRNAPAAATTSTAPLPVDAFRRNFGSEPLPPKDDEALEKLLDSTERNAWVEDAEFRRRWMFLTEKAALGRFGTPDSVQQNGTNVTWIYVNATSLRARTLRLYFSDGRLWRILMNK